jgi:hypothetical protein
MNERQKQQELLFAEPGCVIKFSEDHFIYEHRGHQVLSFEEICELLHTSISDDIDHEEENWTYTGIQCSMMTPGKHWQTGRLKIRLEFIPDEVPDENSNAQIETTASEISPLDDIRQSLLNQSES